MVLANSTPFIFTELGFPIWIRILFSVAAPIFIFLSGFNCALNFSKKKIFEWKRPIQILLIAILIDCFIWQTRPFQTFDILYLIATCLIIWNLLFYLVSKPQSFIFYITLIALSLTMLPIKYTFDLPDNASSTLFYCVKRWLWDGWFPLIPWLAISGFGVLYFYFKNKIDQKTKWLLIISLFFFTSFILHNYYTDKWLNASREGYLEIFYPLQNFILLFAFGIIFLLPFILKKTFKLPIVSFAGQHSLFFYFFHLSIISFIIEPFFAAKKINISILNYIMFVLCWIAVIFMLNFLVAKLKQLNTNKMIKTIYYIIGL